MSDFFGGRSVRAEELFAKIDAELLADIGSQAIGVGAMAVLGFRIFTRKQNVHAHCCALTLHSRGSLALP